MPQISEHPSHDSVNDYGEDETADMSATEISAPARRLAGEASDSFAFFSSLDFGSPDQTRRPGEHDVSMLLRDNLMESLNHRKRQF